MQQFSLVYNNLSVFLEAVDEPRPTYACGQLMQGSSTNIPQKFVAQIPVNLLGLITLWLHIRGLYRYFFHFYFVSASGHFRVFFGGCIFSNIHGILFFILNETQKSPLTPCLLLTSFILSTVKIPLLLKLTWSIFNEVK